MKHWNNFIDPGFLASVLVWQYLSHMAKMNLAVFQSFHQLAQNLAAPEHLLGDNMQITPNIIKPLLLLWDPYLLVSQLAQM